MGNGSVAGIRFLSDAGLYPDQEPVSTPCDWARTPSRDNARRAADSFIEFYMPTSRERGSLRVRRLSGESHGRFPDQRLTPERRAAIDNQIDTIFSAQHRVSASRALRYDRESSCISPASSCNLGIMFVK
jgi:hypothetical protein